MESRRLSQRRATSLVRTLVVASATLAILLVCFSIYQYSQLAPQPAPARRSTPPLSPVRGDPGEYARTSGRTDAPGVEMGQVRIGPGERTQITIYQPRGRRAQLEIEVTDWTPVQGSGNEFLLTEPEVRMRTKDGHAVRITAEKGVLEADRRRGAGLDPQRGRLIGDVVIEYDRLTEDQRAQLPEELRRSPDPSQIVRIELEEIEFDLEYAKLVAPGRLHLSAREIDLQAGNVEVRFNERESRVEYMRIGQGGRLVLSEEPSRHTLGLPGLDTAGRRLSVAQWLRASIQASLDAPPGQPTASEPKPATSAPTSYKSGVPVFREDAGEQDTPTPPIRYLARFEGRVVAKQLFEDAIRTRLEADTLEILRDLSDKDRGRVRSASPDQTPKTGEVATPAREQLVVEWTERLVVETCAPDDERCRDETRSKLTAVGSPARISLPEGNATCDKLTFDPDASGVWLFGSDDHPVRVRYAGQGTLTGRAVYSKRQGDDMYILAKGPGTLLHNPQTIALANGASETEAGSRSTVEFTDELEVQGRFATKTTIDFTGGITSREQRVIEQASFVGGVRMQQDALSLAADAATLLFGSERTRRDNWQAIERINAQGHVVLTQGADRMTCREMDIALTANRNGQVMPRTLTALGDVTADQGERSIQARDKLTVDFEMINRHLPPFDAAKAYTEAVKSGIDVAAIDWETRRREHEAAVRSELGIRRLRAAGDVMVSDPTQALELSADNLDCTVTNGRDIETALVIGLEDQPATVRLDTFTVTGREIKVDVSDQWAEVPGAGRMTFRSRKDLDGRRLTDPIPIAITWNDWMKYHGRENRSVFQGRVHATSRTTTTFDCEDRLVIEFEDVHAETVDGQPAQDWWILQDLVDQLSEPSFRHESRGVDRGFRKEPTYLLATGNAVVVTSDIDEATGRVKTRARIAGPKLSVNLRPDVSKMLIEGPGNLLLEDNRPITQHTASTRRTAVGLFDIEQDSGPSNTLIEWDDLMWYDFSIEQTRFEGNVNLTHFSGAELMRIRRQSASESADAPPGRATFLTCDVLVADFLDRDKRARRAKDRRMGRLGATLLRQFAAEGSVTLQDNSEGLSLTAGRLVYERERQLLAIYGAHQQKARIVIQRPGQFPRQVAAERLFYNLQTGQGEVSKPVLNSR